MDSLALIPTVHTVFQRTGLGQIEVLARRIPLQPLERRLLQMVTGHTQLGDLLGLLGEAHVPVQAVLSLQELGLIRPTAPRAGEQGASQVCADWVMLFGSPGASPSASASWGPDWPSPSAP